ncbi:iron-containing alcohol dehydrogenase family protein [Natronorarus salvus]|uniref:iron-containing alcohol dehydrogenase family protein n=1 Tax=Natronorarus salvus TaxID=3117733 RepID=UPI002F25FD05
MLPIAGSFEYDYRGCDLLYGRGRVADLGEYLARRGRDRALIVCGSNVGANEALMARIREGLGERHVGTFDGTVPEKRVETAFSLIGQAEETGADVLVGVGGGSSLDTARQASLLATDDRSLSDLREEALEGAVRSPEPTEDPLPVVVVPTTFAGADVSAGGSLEVLPASDSPTGQPITVSGSAMPIADVADPALVETSPPGVLAGSAMNGLDKGIETPYARDANPVSDALAVHGLRLMSDALPRVVGEGEDAAEEREAMDRAVVGSLLVQLDRKISIVHAFGHGFARRYSVQQGAVHAAVVPHVLEYLFGEVDGSRSLLARGFGVDPEGLSDDEVADAVVERVAEVRDSIGLPARLRELPETREEDLPAIAAFVVDDPPMERSPTDPTVDEIERVLRAAW